MRKIIFLLYFMIVSGIASAAQQCVNFGELVVPMDEYNAEWGGVDWSLAWSYITIRGISVCAMTQGELADVVDTIEYDDVFYNSGNSNTYCWCRIISPAVSAWIAYGDLEDAEYCLESCARECADSVFLRPVFKSAMLGSFGG